MKKNHFASLPAILALAGLALFSAHAAPSSAPYPDSTIRLARDAHSAHSAHGHDGHGSMTAPAESGLVNGVVKKIDKAGGKVTLAHGPLSNLNMPAMTMVFRVKDAAWLDRMRVDDRIRFVADSIGGTLTIVRFEPER
ncbi:MAG: copper-binding protein [Candidatus Accumulibacter sp.]|jgi:Cu/Ag efflux protein CusF|nr:copper-binding protein [Accumulibacter sp.]